MTPGCVEKREFDYKRPGVLALFAALKVHEGSVIAKAEMWHIHVVFLFCKECLSKVGQTERVAFCCG